MTGTKSPVDRWRLRLHTALNMRPAQLTGIAERRLRHALVPFLPIDFDARYEQQIPGDIRVAPEALSLNAAKLRESLTADERTQCRKRLESVRRGEVRFLNRSLSLADPGSVAWEHERLDEYPRLWRLKLHGFEPLSWAVRGYEEPQPAFESLFEEWIRDWIASHRIGDEAYLRGAWTPYAVSLRLTNWCRYLAWRSQRELADDRFELRRAIFKQASFLRNHLEFDVGGNHLVENGAALVVAGTLLSGHGRAFLDDGVVILRNVAETQFLDDGGHFERSPMYHLLVLERYLTVIDLLDGVGYPVPEAVRRTARDATRFVTALRPPDGKIPLLNDSVYGQALSIGSVLEYAERVGVNPSRGRTVARCLRSSGYYWLGSGSDRMLVDGGPPGPSHLPGHSHNDHLQVLLWLDGRGVITDTGVFHYTPDEKRKTARSVRSHNTVQVGDSEPIEIGGRYLMGRRTEPTVTYDCSGEESALVGRYEARPGRRTDYVHRRCVNYRPTRWLVWDALELTEPTTVYSRIHLAPGVDIERETRNRIELLIDDAPCWVYPLRADEVVRTTSSYYPEFGVEEQRPSLELRTHCDGAASFGYLVSTERHKELELDVVAGDPAGLVLDGEYECPLGVCRPLEVSRDDA